MPIHDFRLTTRGQAGSSLIGSPVFVVYLMPRPSITPSHPLLMVRCGYSPPRSHGHKHGVAHGPLIALIVWMVQRSALRLCLLHFTLLFTTMSNTANHLALSKIISFPSSTSLGRTVHPPPPRQEVISLSSIFAIYPGTHSSRCLSLGSESMEMRITWIGLSSAPRSSASSSVTYNAFYAPTPSLDVYYLSPVVLVATITNIPFYSISPSNRRRKQSLRFALRRCYPYPLR